MSVVPPLERPQHRIVLVPPEERDQVRQLQRPPERRQDRHERGGSAELFREADRMVYIAKSRGEDAVAPDPVTCRAAARSRRSAGRNLHPWE